MTGQPPSIAAGVEHHAAGRLDEAEAIYRGILEHAPDHADALHLLGVARMQRGQLDEAVELISRAVERQPANPAFLSNLGTAHLERDETEDAIRLFRDALLHDPDHVDARFNLGNALRRSGAADQALDQFLAVAERHPGHAFARNNAALCLLEREAWEPAIEHLTAALEAAPGFADAHANLAMALFSLDRLDEAERHCTDALSLAPDLATALVCLGNVHHARDQLDMAIECYRRATAADANYGAAFNNLGNALAATGRYDEALAPLGRAVELASDAADALNNTGEVLKSLGRFDEAIAAYDTALAGDPSHGDARFGRALVHLLQGRFAAGWPDYLARDSMAGRADAFDRTRLPADLSGQRILVDLDQGLGDELFFLRFMPALRARGAHVAYRSDPRLAAMLRRARIAEEIVGGEKPDGGWDRRIAVGDLPYLLEAGAEPPPPSIRLEPLPEQAREMAARLAAFGPPPHTGLTWRAGSSDGHRLLFKNAPLDLLAASLRHAPGSIVALQRNPDAGEIDRLAAALDRPVLDLTAMNADLEAMLALAGALDDYVAVSNTNVHLRWVLGRPSRVLVPNPPEFRWMAAGRESPWFPGTTVYRQGIDSDWQPALAELAHDLQAAHG